MNRVIPDPIINNPTALNTRLTAKLAELQAANRQLQDYADQMANLAVEQERNRLARDLHDSVTQTIFSMNLTVQTARMLVNDMSALGGLITLEDLANYQPRIRQVLRDGSGTVYGKGFMTAQVELPEAGADRLLTYYTRHGDVFGWACVAITGAVLVAGPGWSLLGRHGRVRKPR